MKGSSCEIQRKSRRLESHRIVCVQLDRLLINELGESLVDVVTGVLSQLALRVENDECNLTIAENGELDSLLDKTVLAFGEGSMPAALIVDASNLDFLAAHFCSQ